MITAKPRVANSALSTIIERLSVSVIVIAGLLAALPTPCARAEQGGPQASSRQGGSASPRLPNLLVLMADHLRGDTVDPQGQCLTPNMDRLAAEGVRFARCYTPNGMCSPARASLMTATYPSTHGVWDCTHTQRPAWVDVSPELDHWAQRLAAAGYRTGYFGKWHVSQSVKLEQYGWQEYEIEESTTYRGPGVVPGTQVISRKEGYGDKMLAAVRQDGSTPPHHPAYDLGIDFIRRHAASGAPFCCFVSTHEPGSNVPPKQFMDLYDVRATRVSPTLHDDLSGKSEMLKRIQEGWNDVSDIDWQMITTCYLAQVTYIDSEMGRIIQALRDSGCYEDTAIVVLADHGQMLGAHGLIGLGLGLAYEEVYRIPLILRLPQWCLRDANGPLGRGVDDALVSLVDVGPTLLDFFGLAPLPHAQGRSLRPVIEGRYNTADWQDAYAEFFGQRFMYSQRIVWHGDWKYTFTPGGVDELYNLKSDPYEERNLASDEPHRGMLLEMTKRMWRTMARIGDNTFLDADYLTLRTAPIGPLSIQE